MLNRVAVADGAEAPENLLLDATIEEVATAIADKQAGDGHWVYELEADATIPSELILLNHYLDETAPALEAKLANYLKGVQGDHGQGCGQDDAPVDASLHSVDDPPWCPFSSTGEPVIWIVARVSSRTSISDRSRSLWM